MKKTTPKDYGRDGTVGMKNIKLPKGATKEQKAKVKERNK